MLTRVTKVLIGKNIARTANLPSIYDGSTVPADGEVIVLDKNKDILAAGATIADTDIVYLAQGTAYTYNYTNDAGTAITGARKLKFSDPIEGAKVKAFRGTSYTAKVERVITFAAITAPLTAGVEYVLRIVYKDVDARRGQFSKTYRFIATTTTSQSIFDGLRAKIAADSGARVTGSGTTTLILTAKAIPECTTSVNDIDAFSMVDFDAFLTYVDSTTNRQVAVTGAAKTHTYCEYGVGNWENVRDAEKAQLGNEGIQDQTTFPKVSHELSVVKDATYHAIVIEHDKSYQSPDNQYVKSAPMTTVVYIPTAAGQLGEVLAVLNPWMASLPGAFANVTF